eukprot:393562-Pyramimonas_sp.AAC.1
MSSAGADLFQACCDFSILQHTMVESRGGSLAGRDANLTSQCTKYSSQEPILTWRQDARCRP